MKTEIKTSRKMEKIGCEQSEYTTRFLARSGRKYYVGVKNGGSRGSHQPADQVNGNWGFWHEPLREISEAEAQAEAEMMGVEL